MTSSLRRNFRSSGFTLVELLVVIGMIVLLVAIAIPVVSRAHRAALRTTMAADLAVISNALEAYKGDFGDYPRRTVTDIAGTPITGAAILCWALVAPGPAVPPPSANGLPGDGADGPGFRTRGTSGAVKGPYLPADRFTIGTSSLMSPLVTPQLIADDRISVLGDRNYHPILYFPANKGPDPYSTTVPDGSYLGTSPQAVFNFADNDPSTGPVYTLYTRPNILNKYVMRYRLGATGKTPGILPDGNLYSPQVPAALGPYLIWSPGPDGYYGTADDVANNGNDLQLNTSALPPSVEQSLPNTMP